MELIKYFGVIGITLMIVKYALPIQWIKKHYKMDMDSNHDKHPFKKIPQKLFNCAFCLGFWVGLILYQDIYWGVVISFSAEIIYLAYNKLTNLI